MDKKAGYKFDVYTEHDWEVNKKFSDGYYFKDSGDAIGLIDGFIDGDNYSGSTNPVFRSVLQKKSLKIDKRSPNPVFKSVREYQFPLERILKASAIDIKKAKATEKKDEKYIKNTI